ncbi:NAD(P)H-hydrate epimerase [Rhodophyticola sp. CCM32]|uniref:NAD(P)H-hydrate epimerase n=1 Tax=Rhodophyticola sp. CCM32 TaxID=2916397 RepID=UPI00107F868D|nr:NAD(P)H-hydrate epimerase [Rhodophyticola sp. CCM32]
MAELLTAARMRAIEQDAIKRGDVTGLALMERAGQGVVEAILEQWPAFAQGPQRAALLCGPGNNGGDGFVVARMLKARGWRVALFLYGDPTKLPPDAGRNYKRWIKQGGQVHPGLPAHQAPDFRLHYDLVIEALFGIGLTRPLRHPFPDIISNTRLTDTAPGPAIVSVDIPAGLDADTGQPLGGEHAFSADLTVTFHGLKKGHVMGRGPSYCGKVVVKDIGL